MFAESSCDKVFPDAGLSSLLQGGEGEVTKVPEAIPRPLGGIGKGSLEVRCSWWSSGGGAKKCSPGWSHDWRVKLEVRLEEGVPVRVAKMDVLEQSQLPGKVPP